MRYLYLPHVKAVVNFSDEAVVPPREHCVKVTTCSVIIDSNTYTRTHICKLHSYCHLCASDIIIYIVQNYRVSGCPISYIIFKFLRPINNILYSMYALKLRRRLKLA